MATIVTRAGKGSPLTNAEVDANFTNLNNQLAQALFGANNLSDVANAATARSNLGVAIGTNVQAWDADLDAIAALTGTSGILTKTAANTWSLDTTVYANTGGSYADPSWITSLAASKLTGTVASARLGTGTANNTTFLRGDGTWQVVSVPVTSVFGRTGDVTLASSDVTTALGATPVYTTTVQTVAGAKYFSDTGCRVAGAYWGQNNLYVYESALNALTIRTGAAGSEKYSTFSAAGDFTSAGNVTAYSDERLKTDWAPVADNFVERLAAVKHGSYTRIDGGQRQAGVSAQDMQALLPESVVDGEYLSLAYGNAALVSCVQLARKVVTLEKQLKALEEKVKA